MSEDSKARLSFSPDASLDELMSIAQARFPVNFETIKIGSYSLDILQISDLEAYIDHLGAVTPENKGLELPFWAKIWPTSILLSYYVQKLPPTKIDSILELGSGVGLCGLFAARHGFQVTISDNHDDALLFSQINILKNNLSGQARVQPIDFTRDVLSSRFPFIMGSEILYRESTYTPLIKFLIGHISHSPFAEIVLAKNYTLSAKQFFDLAQEKFTVSEKVIGYREDDSATERANEKHLSQIYRLRPKDI